MNAYGYVGGNPLVWIDPWGLIKIKTGSDGADVSKISPAISKHYPVIDNAVKNNSKHKEAVITSGNDGKHKKGSKHYTNNAIDIRGNNVTDKQMQTIADEIQKNLGNDYDVETEYFPDNPKTTADETLWDHIHIEYDPPKTSPKTSVIPPSSIGTTPPSNAGDCK